MDQVGRPVQFREYILWRQMTKLTDSEGGRRLWKATVICTGYGLHREGCWIFVRNWKSLAGGNDIIKQRVYRPLQGLLRTCLENAMDSCERRRIIKNDDPILVSVIGLKFNSITTSWHNYNIWFSWNNYNVVTSFLYVCCAAASFGALPSQLQSSRAIRKRQLDAVDFLNLPNSIKRSD